MILSEIAESVMCDIIKIRLLSISLLGIFFPTLFLIVHFQTNFYDVAHDIFRCPNLPSISKIIYKFKPKSQRYLKELRLHVIY